MREIISDVCDVLLSACAEKIFDPCHRSDLKKMSLRSATASSKKFGFENLTFLHGDIAGYEGVDQVDMVVTLHAL